MKIIPTLLLAIATVTGAAGVANATPTRWFLVSVYVLPGHAPEADVNEVTRDQSTDDLERICKVSAIEMQKRLDSPLGKIDFGDAIAYCLPFTPH